MPTIKLPHNFTPRHYQLPVLRALDSGRKRAVAVWHRRAGKEKTFLNFTIKSMANRVGTYFYLFPTYTQAKKAIWDGMDRNGFPFMAHFPPEFVKARDGSELKVTAVNGSIFQLVGSDNINSLMSTNPIGCVFAEYSLQDPTAWDYMRPILRENGGWAVFDYTPRGKNHGFKMYEMARQLMQDGDPQWFAQRLTVDDTQAMSQSDIDAERREGMSEEMVQQEYYCSFEGVMQGAIFGKQLELADRDKRICGVPWIPDIAVDTWWDIGTKDPTAIWFTQNVGREIHVIDYYENNGIGVGPDFYLRHLQTLSYVWGQHNGPHDIEAHQFAANGKSTKEVMKALGFTMETVPRCDNKTDSINAARNIIARCYFDAKKCQRGLDALRQYHYEYDEKRQAFKATPYHGWESNGADAFQQLGLGHKLSPPKKKPTLNIYTVQEGDQGLAWMGN